MHWWQRMPKGGGLPARMQVRQAARCGKPPLVPLGYAFPCPLPLVTSISCSSHFPPHLPWSILPWKSVSFSMEMALAT